MIDREQVYNDIAKHAAAATPENCLGSILSDGAVLCGERLSNLDDAFGFYFAVESADAFTTTHADLMRMNSFGAAYVRVGVDNGKAKWFRADRLGVTPRGDKFLVPIWPPEMV